MIEKETILELMREQVYKPMSVQELQEVFHVQTAEDLKQLMRLLNELEHEGEILRTRTNRYGIPERMNVLKGRIQGNAKGFAFLIPELPEMTDVYIAESDLNGAFHGDKVLVRVNRAAAHTGERAEGEVLRILSREISEVVGTFQSSGTYGFVIADDKRISQDIFIPKEEVNGAADGHKVVVQITKYPEGRRSAEGKVTEILGHKNDPDVDIIAIIRKFGLPEAFPAEVMQEAEEAPQEISPEELKERRDLREQTTVTIDGPDAKDLDDAISIKRNEQGHYVLDVHIADISYYVPEGSHLDQEAYRRGNSVYLVDRVIPMLPHRLSNGICSLNPQEDRLTLTCQMEISPQGEVLNHEIFPSVIRTTERMTYEEVRQIVEREDEEVLARYEPLVPFFDHMKELALILQRKRITRGAIDFNFKEAKVLVDEEGKPTDVVLRDRTISERIIEEFMLVANETIAEHFHWLQVPFIYRIHEDPKEEKLQAFLEFVTNFGYVVRGTANSVHPRSLQQLLEQVQDTPEEGIISSVMLRSMKQAKYSPNSLGHFGLSTEFYTHFTAPIRRYSDLIVHRLIRTYLFEGDLSEETQARWREKLEEIAEQCSYRERLAVDAERETDDLKKAEFMLDKIGEEYEGIISGVTSFGLFVELENTIEGLVHVSYLTDDYYHYHERQYAMIGERTGKIYRLGDTVNVRVLQVNREEHSIDFELVGSKPRRERSPKKGGPMLKAKKRKAAENGKKTTEARPKVAKGRKQVGQAVSATSKPNKRRSKKTKKR